MYQKHDRSIIDGMDEQNDKLLVKAYIKFMSNAIPIESEGDLEESLNSDVFLQAAVTEFMFAIY